MTVRYDRDNPRLYSTGRYSSGVGRSKVEIKCPFCSAEFWAFVWSISGGGKKCPTCGAMHNSMGEAYRVISNG